MFFVLTVSAVTSRIPGAQESGLREFIQKEKGIAFLSRPSVNPLELRDISRRVRVERAGVSLARGVNEV